MKHILRKGKQDMQQSSSILSDQSSQPTDITSRSFKNTNTKKSKGGIITKVIVGAVLIVVIAVILLSILLPLAGFNTGVPTVTAGTLKVRYNSVWGNDVKIYIDGEDMGVINSDVFVTYHGISPGTHKVEAYTLEGSYLDGKTVEVEAGRTTVVELSFLS